MMVLIVDQPNRRTTMDDITKQIRDIPVDERNEDIMIRPPKILHGCTCPCCEKRTGPIGPGHPCKHCGEITRDIMDLEPTRIVGHRIIKYYSITGEEAKTLREQYQTVTDDTHGFEHIWSSPELIK